MKHYRRQVMHQRHDQYELEEVLLPDPRYLADAELDRLKSIMSDLIDQPVRSILAESDEAAWADVRKLVAAC